jgi:hypothetical protein
MRSSGNLENEIQLLAQETKINSLKNDLFGIFALNFFSVLIQFFSIFYFEWICLTKPISNEDSISIWISSSFVYFESSYYSLFYFNKTEKSNTFC